MHHAKFQRMTDDIQSMDYAIGSHANLIWINDYLRYLANPSASKLDILFGWSGPEGNDTQAKQTGPVITSTYIVVLQAVIFHSSFQ